MEKKQPVRFCDKFLPDQQEHKYFYKGNDYPAALYDVICHSSGIESPDQEFKLEKTDKFTIEEMASNPISLRYLQFLIRASGVKRVLEIGAFIGVSAMYFAKALPADGQVVTIEKFDHFAGIAKRNFALNGLQNKITLHEGDAFEIIERLPKNEKFDMIFIDGNKEKYKDYFVMTEPLLSDRGISLVDDCFFHGDVANQVTTNEKGAGTKAFLEYAATRTDYHRIALPLANGIMMMTRKS
jgi:predicted O-methyltransferase YrrM